MIAHILGALAVITFFMSFQLKTRRNIIIVNLTSRMLYILQYICLGAFEGAVLDFMGFMFSFVAKYKDKSFISKHFPVIIVTVDILLLLAGFAMYENLVSLFAIAGIILEITALWLTKEKNIRILSLLSAPFWLVYNTVNGAYGSSVGNIAVMVSISIAIYRLDINSGKGGTYHG